MYAWTDDELTAYFESSGVERPSGGGGTGFYKVVFAPRVAVRAQPQGDAKPIGAKPAGTVIKGTAVESDSNWVKLVDDQSHSGGFVMIRHPQHGTLLEPQAPPAVPPPAAAPPQPPPPEAPPLKKTSLKKDFGDVSVGRKACGANMKTADGAGASRDALFDHFAAQELLQEFQVKFVAEGIPDHMYNTDLVTDTECVHTHMTTCTRT